MPRRLQLSKTAPSGRNARSLRVGSATARQDFTHKKLERVHLAGTNFRQSLFIGAVLSDCHFKSVSFDRCDFSGTRFVGCTFEKCRFVPAEIRSCVITGCDFDQCDFKGAQWHGIVTERTKFLECDFRETSIRESSFATCHLLSCRLRRSSIIMNYFSSCAFTKVDFGDCTALFLFFDNCKFNHCRINAETIGFTYGLSEGNLDALQLIHLGRPQTKPSSTTLIDDLIDNYVIRRWNVGACILQLNFRRAMPLLSLRALATALAETIDREIPLDWDEMHFLVQVLERIHAEERLPLAGLWTIATTLNRHSVKSSRFQSVTAAADLTLRQLDRLVLGILDQIALLQADTDQNKQAFWLHLRLSEQPGRSLGELLPLTVYRIFGGEEISLVRSRVGSWIETWQLGLSALIAVQVSLVIVNGVVHQLVKLTEQAERLAKKLPKRHPKRAILPPPSSRAYMPSLSTEITATHARTTPPALNMLIRIDAALKALSALSDDDLEKLRAYAADRIQSASVRRVSRRRISRTDPERQPTV